MSLKIKVINRKTGRELEMDQSEAQRLRKLVMIPKQPTKKIKIPREYKRKAKEVLPQNISDKTEEE